MIIPMDALNRLAFVLLSFYMINGPVKRKNASTRTASKPAATPASSLSRSEHSPAAPVQLGRNLTYGMLDALGRAIVIGSYDSRGFPTEAELAKQHGVSRSVTREAVKMLTAKGLLSARPRQGTTVQPSTSWNLFDTDVLRWLLERKFSVDLLRHFNQLRVAIEPEAAALAATFADERQFQEIDAGLARMEAAEDGHDNALDADIAFHVAILRASGNPFFMQFRDVVSTALRTSIQFTNRIKGRTASVSDHAAVRDAIVRRHADGARVAMKKIIADVLELIETAETSQKRSR